MAFPSTLFPLLSLNSAVSDEEYRLFHTIDIKLIKTFIRRLGINRLDALNVVAFLIWLERKRLCVNAVYKLVNLYWPDDMVRMLAHQVLAVLRMLENSVLMQGDIGLIEELCDREIGVSGLHRRRLEILDERNKIVEEMCERAFEDVFGRAGDQGVGFAAGHSASDSRQINENRVGFAAGPSASDSRQINENRVGFAAGPSASDDPRKLQNNRVGFVARPSASDPRTFQRFAGGFGGYASGPVNPQQVRPFHGGHVKQFGVVRAIPPNGAGFGSPNVKLPDVVVGPRRAERMMRNSEGTSSGGAGTSNQKERLRDPIPEHEVARLLRGINVTTEDIRVHPDDRTVFLTFSRGYPVSEQEIRNFFTRRFGNFIRVIELEPVLPGVQPLYARMVAQNPSILPLICDVDEEIRTRYIVNGKHVWAKKYERRFD